MGTFILQTVFTHVEHKINTKTINVCKNHDYCYIEMPKGKSIMRHNHGKISMKVPFIIYADLKSLPEKNTHLS